MKAINDPSIIANTPSIRRIAVLAARTVVSEAPLVHIGHARRIVARELIIVMGKASKLESSNFFQKSKTVNKHYQPTGHAHPAKHAQHPRKVIEHQTQSTQTAEKERADGDKCNVKVL